MAILNFQGVIIALSFLSVCYSYSTTGTTTEYIDLSYDLDESSLFYPGQRFDYQLFRDHQGYNETQPEHQRYWFAMYSFCMGEHGGTHLDAPFHFFDKGWRPAQIPINRLVDICAVIVDVEPIVFRMHNPQDFILTVEHFQEHERKYGQIPLGCFVIVHTGWGRFWPEKQEYWGIDATGTFNFPGLSDQAAKWLAKERMPVGVGIDTQSMDIGNIAKNGGINRAHIALLPHQIYFIENMANLKALLEHVHPGYYSGGQTQHNSVANIVAGVYQPQCDLRLTVMPIKSLGTGGPTRVIGYCKQRC